MITIPALHSGMKPRQIRRELKKHRDPRFTCHCMACLYGRALLARHEGKDGIGARLWEILIGRQVA